MKLKDNQPFGPTYRSYKVGAKPPSLTLFSMGIYATIINISIQQGEELRRVQSQFNNYSSLQMSA